MFDLGRGHARVRLQGPPGSALSLELRDRPWASVLRLVPPQLGLLQPAPRTLVEPSSGA